jgi:hypothetical protein
LSDNNVVEGGVGAPEARESDLDHHFFLAFSAGAEGSWRVVRGSLVMVLMQR